MKELKIVKNASYCLICETEVESKHQHDFVRCKCGFVSVDGGKSYLRRLFSDSCLPDEMKGKKCYEDRSLIEEIEVENVKDDETRYYM